MVLSRLGPLTRSHTGIKRKSIVYTDEVDGSDDDWSPEDEDEFDDDSEVDGSDDDWSPEDEDEDDDEGEVDGSDDDWSPEDEDEDEDAQNGVTFETPKKLSWKEMEQKRLEAWNARAASIWEKITTKKHKTVENAVENEDDVNDEDVEDAVNGDEEVDGSDDDGSPEDEDEDDDEHEDGVIKPVPRRRGGVEPGVRFDCHERSVTHYWNRGGKLQQVCAICGRPRCKKQTRCIRSEFHGRKVKDLPIKIDDNMWRALIHARKEYVVQDGDGACGACVKYHASQIIYTPQNVEYLKHNSRTTHDARKIKILSAHVRDTLNGKLPRDYRDVATIARWDHENAAERDGVQIGDFWRTLTSSRNKDRLERLRNFDDASAKELEFLESCVFREDVRGCQNPARLAANDARKINILSAHVRDKLKGKLPRGRDVATLARWDHENAAERDGVQIGRFWNRIHRSKERLTHVQNYDDDAKNALEYLETCEPRKAERFGPKPKPHL
jgi:hypothetical protein